MTLDEIEVKVGKAGVSLDSKVERRVARETEDGPRFSLGRTRQEAGFSMLEVILAIAILAVVGLGIHQATLAGVRHMQKGKAQAAQAKRLEYAIDLVRADACALGSLLTAEEDYGLVLEHDVSATVRKLEGEASDPNLLMTVKLELPEVEGATGVTQVLLLDLGRCD